MCGLVAAVHGAQKSESDTASVRVEASTQVDDILPNPNIELLNARTKKKTGEFRNSAASKIPYGEYVLRIREPGFKYFEQRISVRQPDVHVRVRLVLAEIANYDR